jgi:type IX secretion system PorP/SprF family membrane protein
MLFFLVEKVCAQDAAFSQYYSSYLYLNPAYAGSEPSLTAGVNSRTQWKSVTEPYQTNQISLIVPFYRKINKQSNFGGLGISLYNDKAGSGKLSATGVNINLSYVLKVTESSNILFGIQGGMIQKSIDFASLQWGSQYNRFVGYDVSVDPNATSSGNLSERTLYPDLGAGLIYYYKPGRDIREKGMSFYAGAASYHLNQPNESLVKDQVSRLPMLNKVHAGFDYSISTKFNVSPNVLVAQQNNLLQINAGMYVNYGFGNPDSRFIPSDLIVGAWYRVGDAYIASVGLGCDTYTIGFSYDVNNSSLRTETRGRGAYEISLRITKPRVIKTRRNYTPRI